MPLQFALIDPDYLEFHTVGFSLIPFPVGENPSQIRLDGQECVLSGQLFGLGNNGLTLAPTTSGHGLEEWV